MEDMFDMFAPGGECGPYVPEVATALALKQSAPPSAPPLLPLPPPTSAAWAEPYDPDMPLMLPPPRPPPTPPLPSSYSPPPSRRRVKVFIVARLQTNGKDLAWYEFLLTLGRDHAQYLLPEGDCAASATRGARAKHLLGADVALERYQDHGASAQARAEVFVVPLAATQRPNPARWLHAPTSWVWATEAEVAGHATAGPPSVLGVPVAPWAVTALAALPVRLRFATPEPPLVLYHGTSVEAAEAVAQCGKLLPSSVPAMCGPGVYLGRWDKAVSFALAGADGVPRPRPGVVIRCVVATGRTRTLTERDTCTCGCRRPCVDHHAVHAAGFDTTFVADGSTSARRAEWCVRDPSRVIVQGMFDMSRSRA